MGSRAWRDKGSRIRQGGPTGGAMATKVGRWISALVVASAMALPAGATTITVSFENSPDATVIPLEDHWRASFVVSDRPGFEAFSGFDMFFDPSRFGALSALSAPTNWDVFLTQPDAGLGADGVYEAQASADLSAPTGPFVMGFVWLGPGHPEDVPLPFAIFAADPPFEVTERGSVVPADAPVGVPAPGSLALISAGLMLLGRRRG